MSISRNAVSRIGSMDVLICATLILSITACSPAPSVEPRPVSGQSAVEPPRSTVDRGPVHFSGVDIVPMDRGAFAVRIHSGLVGNGPRLYVIDGHPMAIDPSVGIGWLKLEDISRITVLKDPADLAIYGPRGVNGVITITTKHGATPR
jgi:TonB-dependent SusC/RagA subfamily outer membrane receptor